MNKKMSAILMIVVFLIGLGVGYEAKSIIAPPTTVGLSGEVKIGALEDRSGALTTYGEEIKVAYDLAEKDVNAYLEAAGAGWWIKIIHEDTASSPETALEKFESLAAKGIKIILGPMMSPACSSVRDYAESHNILYISPSATAVTLSIPGDNLFRFCAIDDLQGPAIGLMMISSGVTHAVSAFVSNDWGIGLNKSAISKFVSLGGVAAQYIQWPGGTTDFTSIVESINTAVTDTYNSGVPLSEIGVFVASYREIISIFSLASEYPLLKQVKWFGTDGTVMIPELVDLDEHPTETEFALATNFTSTMFKIPMGRTYKSVHDRIVEELGREPTIYAYSAYDSVWVVALALATVNEYDAMKVKAILPKIADMYIGASGDILLNENGDLAVADYSLWRPVRVNETCVKWMEVGVYHHETDTIEWKAGFSPA